MVSNLARDQITEARALIEIAQAWLRLEKMGSFVENRKPSIGKLDGLYSKKKKLVEPIRNTGS